MDVDQVSVVVEVCVSQLAANLAGVPHLTTVGVGVVLPQPHPFLELLAAGSALEHVPVVSLRVPLQVDDPATALWTFFAGIQPLLPQFLFANGSTKAEKRDVD
jgi:hypothetical protein